MASDGLGFVERWAHRYPLRIGDTRLTLLLVRIVRSFLGVRVMGLAAEMTYYTLLSIFPLIGALGASLGFLERIIGRAAVEQVEVADGAHRVDGLGLGGTDARSSERRDEVEDPLQEAVDRRRALGEDLRELVGHERPFRSAGSTVPRSDPIDVAT